MLRLCIFLLVATICNVHAEGVNPEAAGRFQDEETADWRQEETVKKLDLLHQLDDVLSLKVSSSSDCKFRSFIIF